MVKYLSWIFKSVCDATATVDATTTHKIAIFKSLNSVSIGGMENNLETLTGSVAAVIQQCHWTSSVSLGFLKNDWNIHVLLAAMAVAVASVVAVTVTLASLDDLKIQLW